MYPGKILQVKYDGMYIFASLVLSIFYEKSHVYRVAYGVHLAQSK